MPKIKEPRAPLKGQDPKTAPKVSATKRKIPPTSQEVTAESDSEDSSSESSSGHSSGSESDADKRKNTKKPRPQKVAETQPNSPPVPDSTSEEEDDSSEGEDTAPVKVNGNKAALKTSTKTKPAPVDISSDSSDESEDSDSDEEMEDISVKKATTAPKVNGAVKPSKPVTDIETGSSTPESTKRKRGADNDKTPSKPTETGPLPKFEAPPGYSVIDFSRTDSTTISNLLTPTTLSSKQIWHITAPAGVPLSEIKSVSQASIANHHSVLSHKGVDYRFVEEKQVASNEDQIAKKRVLVPTDGGKGYAAIDAPVTRTLHIQQHVNLPNLTKRQANPASGSVSAAELNKPAVRGIKPQPKGMRMRFKPSGFGEGDPGIVGSSESEAEEDDDDVEMEDAVESATFRAPKGMPSAAERTKRKDAGPVVDATETPRKEKKRKKDKEAVNGSSVKKSPANGSLAPPTSSLNVDEIPPTPTKEQREAANKAADALVEGTKAEAPVSREEKARLKEEKRQRKEEKRKQKDGM